MGSAGAGAQGNLFLTGRAGTGKTTLLRKFLAEAGDKAVVLAPTGVAAMNAGGQTIHSFFKLPRALWNRRTSAGCRMRGWCARWKRW